MKGRMLNIRLKFGCKLISVAIKIMPKDWHIKKIVMRSAEHEYGIPCDHDWVSGNNEKVTGAEICVKCLSVRASNL